jgi:hypothetical protein
MAKAIKIIPADDIEFEQEIVDTHNKKLRGNLFKPHQDLNQK